MAISTLFPTTRPSLSLDFAKSKRLDPRISFSRAQTGSIASYVDESGLIRYAGPDEPRFDHDPITGESLGLLVEEARTNHFLTSESFISGWGGGGILNSDNIANPTGQVGTVHYVTGSEWTRVCNVTGATKLSVSFFSKKRFGGLERDYNQFDFYQVATSPGFLTNYGFKFDGNNPDTTYVKNVRTTSFPNGWYRFEFQLLPRADYNGGVFSTSTRIDLEGASSDNYIWGIQVEKDTDFSTSYIPTSGTTITRPGDNISVTGTKFSEWYNDNEGTLGIHLIPKIDITANPTVYYIYLKGDGGGGDNIRYIRHNSGNVFDCASQTAYPAGPTNYSGLGASNKNQLNKLYIGFSESSDIFAGKKDGNAYVVKSGLASTVSNSLLFPTAAAATNTLFTIKYICFYPNILSQNQFNFVTK